MGLTDGNAGADLGNWLRLPIAAPLQCCRKIDTQACAGG
jgi:hypothetical protein